MRVVLSKDVQGLGSAGQVKEVSDGYARNYLLPRGLAVAATTSALEQVKAREGAEARRAARQETDAQQLAARLQAQPILIRAKAGEQHRLYGSVTAADIADALSAALGQPFDKRKVELEDPIRALGTYQVPVRVARSVVATVSVDVQPEKGG
jgi:large subunit ribosomal protein L9